MDRQASNNIQLSESHITENLELKVSQHFRQPLVILLILHIFYFKNKIKQGFFFNFEIIISENL